MAIDPKQFSRIVAGSPGVPAWPDIVLYYDAGDPASLPTATSPITEIFDLTNNVSPALIDTGASLPSLVDSHLDFSSDVIRLLNGGRPANTFNIFNGGGTWAFWVRIRSTPVVGRFVDTRGGSSNQGYFFGPRGANPTGYQLEFVRNFSVTNGLWRLAVDAGREVPPYDQWVHIAITYNDDSSANNPTMYINGVSQGPITPATAPSGTAVAESGSNLRLGARGTGGSEAIDGNMDVMVAWSKALTADEVMQHYAATRSRFQGGTGLQLVDRVGTSVATATLTLNGLASAYDAAYLVIGKIIDTTNGIFELRPVPGIALASIQSTLNFGTPSTPSVITSTSGWLVAGALTSDATSNYVSFFTAWIWPGMGRFGGTTANAQARLCRSIGTAYDNGTTKVQEGFGIWRDTSVTAPFESMTVSGFGGTTMEAGSEVSIYRLGYGEDPT